MTTEYFKVRNGLSIGEDTLTVDATTGNLVSQGSITGSSLTLTTYPSTTAITEGTNLYYTDARSRSALSAGTGITYNSSTGAITSSITQYTDALARSSLSASTGVTYDSSTGAISIGQAVATTSSPTFASVTATGNLVKGAIRNSTTAGLGDIWAVNSTGPTLPYRGLSLDNSDNTAKGPATVLRAYSGGAVQGTRGRLIFEKARGTAASPTAVQANDLIGSIDATGYTSTGFINDGVASVIPAFFGFSAQESWVSNTNLGTTFTLTMAPSATTITSAANLISTLTINPQVAIHRSDTFTFQQGKTGTATYLAMDSAKITASLPIKYPTYTTAQRDALAPAAGWVLFNSSTNKLQCYDGTAWNDLF